MVQEDKQLARKQKLVIGHTDLNSLDQGLPPNYLRHDLQQPFAHGGFTLIEILVVMLIISITFGFAMLAVGDFGESRRIRTAAEAFAQFVELMHERALLESSTIQVQLTPKIYSAKKLDSRHHWRRLTPSRNQVQALPKKTQITIMRGYKRQNTLVITMNGNGDMTPFEVYFGTSDHPKLATVNGDDNGRVTVDDL